MTHDTTRHTRHGTARHGTTRHTLGIEGGGESWPDLVAAAHDGNEGRAKQHFANAQPSSLRYASEWIRSSVKIINKQIKQEGKEEYIARGPW